MARDRVAGFRSGWIGAAIFLLISGLWIVSAMPSQAQTYRFNTVAVEGNQQIDAETIAGFARIARGRAMSAAELNAAFQRVSGTGFFRTVDFVPQGNRLVIRVQEYPILSRVNFEGNRRINNDAIAAVVQSRAGRVYSPAQAEQDANAIAELYAASGRLNARITPRLIERAGGRVDLAFEIVEGPVVEIERLTFVGNRSFSDSRLRNAIASAQAGRLSSLFQSDNFNAERIARDRQVLQDFYLSRGFVDAQVLSGVTELTRERDGVFVTYTIREGQQYRIGQVEVVSEIDGIDAAPYRAAVRPRTGSLFTPNTLEAMIEQAERVGYNAGERFVRAEPRLTRNERDGVIDVTLALVRGDRVFVERIDIQGNVTTQDRVIRRQFRIAEGDPLNPREIREAASRIQALGYFSDVRTGVVGGSAPDQRVVDVQVEETTTGSLGFGLSYAQNEGIGGNIVYNESNFLGRGQRVGVNFSTVPNARSLDISFAEPAFLGRELELGLRLGLSNTTPGTFARFATETYRFSPSLAFPVSEFGRLNLRASLSSERMFNVDPAASPRLIAESAGGVAQTTASIGFTYTHDTRRNGPDPDRGFVLRFSQDLAGLADRSWARTTALAGFQQRVLGGDVTLSAELEAGALAHFSGDSRVTERFVLSSQQFRGFRPYGIGPRDTTTGDGLGGNFYAVARLEAQFPLGLPAQYNMSGGLFMDVGSVWGLDGTLPPGYLDAGTMRATLGFALLWSSPLGPLRFNFSTPLMSEATDQVQNFDFSISTRF